MWLLNKKFDQWSLVSYLGIVFARDTKWLFMGGGRRLEAVAGREMIVPI